MPSQSRSAKRPARVLPELQRLLDAVRAGNLDHRADPNGLDPESAQLVVLANVLVDELVRPLRVASGSLAEIAAGRIPEFVIDEYHGEFEVIKRNINTFLATMQGMHHEAQDLIAAITSGRLHARGNEWDFEGAWKDLIRGMNSVVDAFERPFQIASSCVSEISDGKIPLPISQNLKGEYGHLAKNLNLLVRTILQMTSAVTELSQAAVAGELERRIPAENFRGDWQSLVKGINETLDSALAPIQEATRVLEQVAAYDLRARMQGQYAGDHARIKDALNLTAETLDRALIQVAGSSDAVAAASQQIAGAAAEVTAGTQRQVSAVERIARRTSRLVEQSQGNATLSKSALDRTITVSQAVDAGKVSIDRVAVVMADVVMATDASTAVIQEIDAIAVQTDSLATAATEEAGKVAASGRGFAVVAEEVRRLARLSKEAANRMDALLKIIGEILLAHDQSRSGGTRDAIASIVQEIQQIAFQTNLLAVNAAVEAAHVSAASSGFESITGEIHGLAQRVKGAAEKTRTLTRGAHGAAESGQGIASELNCDFVAIVDGVSSITGSVEVIASATSDQQESMRTMAQAMNEIQEVTDSNARSAADSSAAANGLTSEVAALAELLGRFKLGEAENVKSLLSSKLSKVTP